MTGSREIRTAGRAFAAGLLTLFLTASAGAQSAAGPDPAPPLSPQDQVLQKYRHRWTVPGPAGEAAPDPLLDPQWQQRKKRLQLLREAAQERQEKARKRRKDKIESEKIRMQGKAAEKEKAEKAKLDARAAEIEKRAEQRKEEKQERLDKRHEEILDKAEKHRREMQQRSEDYRERRVLRQLELERRARGVNAPPVEGLPPVETPHVSSAVPPEAAPSPHVSGAP